VPRKQRFKPSRKSKLADGTAPLVPVTPPAPISTTSPPNLSSEPPFRPVRGRDAVIDD